MMILRTMWLWLATAVRAAPVLTVVLCLTTIAGTALAPITLLGITMAIGAVASGGSLLPGVLVTASCLVLSAIAGSVGGPIGDTVDEKVWRYVHDDLLRLTAEIPSIAHHEHPELADRLALLERDSHQLGGVYRLLSIIGSVTGAATVSTLLISVHPALGLLLVLALVPAAVSGVGMFRRHATWRTNERFRRLGTKVADVLLEPKQGVEVRCFGMSQALLWVAGEAMDARARPWVAISRTYARLTAVGWAAFTAGYAVSLTWLFGRGQAGLATIGDLTLLLLMAGQVSTTAQGIAGNSSMVMGGLQSFGRYQWLREYAARHTWAESQGTPPARLTHGIRFEHLSFAYPSAEAAEVGDPELSLRDIDLTLPAGKTVAFVGENGAGKSTLVKLLARLYDPTSGAITVDGVPLTDLDPQAWRRRISAGFQDFASLELLLADSVGVGELPSRTDRELIGTAVDAGQADVVVGGLTDGLDTQLGTRFTDGVGLSGGQWQRLALARAFMRTSAEPGPDQAPQPLLMLLDEPTAALDPEAEQAIYERYARTAKELARSTGAVTVLVSHRFSTVRMAELIVVVDDGRISEMGSHAELLAAGGRYAELFQLQARAYR